MKTIFLLLCLVVPVSAQTAQSSAKEPPQIAPPADIPLTAEENSQFEQLATAIDANAAQLKFVEELLQAAERAFDKADDDRKLLFAARQLRTARGWRAGLTRENVELLDRFRAWETGLRTAHQCTNCVLNFSDPRRRRLVRPSEKK